MKWFDKRKRFQKVAENKCWLGMLVTAAVLSLGISACLGALYLIGKPRSTEPAESHGDGIQIPLDAHSLWQRPTGSSETPISSSQPSDGAPSFRPSFQASSQPSVVSSSHPSTFPSTSEPSTVPSSAPTTTSPSSEPSTDPSSPPSFMKVTYQPGNLTASDLNLFLSNGLKVRALAKKNERVKLSNGVTSALLFHERPDFGATFSLKDGGWIYVSNSERKEKGKGGVGALRFDNLGNVLAYNMILTGTTMNCGGGRTPWDSWISCEEIGGSGQAYQVDVQGRRPSAPISMGRGRFESFSFDIRDRSSPRFFLTEDHLRGPIRRFTPLSPNWNNPWSMLHGNGTLEYLLLELKTLTFSWTSNISLGRISAEKYYPECEGIDVNDGVLYFVSKNLKQLYILDLDARRYTNVTTQQGLFDGQPDQVIVMDDAPDSVLYFTEEGGKLPGIHGRNSKGQFFTVLEGKYKDETTGLAFSPNGRFMYFAFQETGLLLEVMREDGMPFRGRSLSIKYHNLAIGASKRI